MTSYREQTPDVKSLAGGVAAVENLGAAAGSEILAAGGNAADAAIACAFAQCVVDPMRCSIAGSAEILVHDVTSNTEILIDAGGYAPRAATPAMYSPIKRRDNAFIVEDGLNRWGYRAQVVPGFLRGMQRLYENFGSGHLSWRTLLNPAIRLAGDGFRIFPHLSEFWNSAPQNEVSGNVPLALSYTSDARRILLRNDDGGRAYHVGELLIQADLARTLECLATEGVDIFYTGDIARKIADDFAQNGGLLTYDDLAEYEPLEEYPLRFRYEGLDFITQGAPSVGPAICQALQVLEGWDVTALGWNSPEYLDRLAGTLYRVFRDRDEYMADPRFADVPLELFTSDDRAKEIRKQVLRGESTAARDSSLTTSDLGETTHVAVIDSEGNSCGITHSVGSGTGLITPGLGIMHNNHMTTFDPRPDRPNSILPGKRGTGGGAPVMALSDGQVVMSMGSPAGAFKASAMVQTVVNFMDFEFTLREAVDADRIHVRSSPQSIVIERLFEPRTAVALGERGHRIVQSDYSARVAAVGYDPVKRTYGVASDKRGDRGTALARVHR